MLRAIWRRAAVAVSPLAAIVPLAGLVPAATGAQGIEPLPRLQWEVRVDAMLRAATAAQVGLAVNVPAGSNLRAGVTAGAGVSRGGGRTEPSGRVDLTARYLLDPFSEIRWAPYAGAGFSAQRESAGPWHGYLLALIGIEGPAHSPWRTALEIGLGGGVRAGIVFRRARSNGR